MQTGRGRAERKCAPLGGCWGSAGLALTHFRRSAPLSAYRSFEQEVHVILPSDKVVLIGPGLLL